MVQGYHIRLHNIRFVKVPMLNWSARSNLKHLMAMADSTNREFQAEGDSDSEEEPQTFQQEIVLRKMVIVGECFLGSADQEAASTTKQSSADSQPGQQLAPSTLLTSVP